MTYTKYFYTMSMNWINGDETLSIPFDRIKSMIIDYDYKKKNMPILFATVSVSKNFADKMILNKSTSKIYLSIDKYADEDIIYMEKYVRGEFLYFINNDINYNKNIDYINADNTDSTEEDEFRTITIGLFKIEFINKNRHTINSVYKSATKTDIILINTRHCNVLMEPLHSDRIFSETFIPPVTSISKLIKHLDGIDSLYKTPYMFFMDLDDTTYIMSTSGTPIPISSSSINNVTLRINDPSANISKIEGFIEDTDNMTYILDIPAANSKMSISNTQDKIYNRLIGISSDGQTTEVDLSINRDPAIKTIDRFISVHEDNTKDIDLLKQSIERRLISISISKEDVDGSIFTPNKSYNIDNFDDYSDHNGDFTINTKREAFVKDGDHFRISVYCNFSKLQS